MFRSDFRVDTQQGRLTASSIIVVDHGKSFRRCFLRFGFFDRIYRHSVIY